MSTFLTPLELEYIDGATWKLTAPFDYFLGTPDPGHEFVRTPAGFITDFASIPRALWSVFPPTGRYGKAAVVHDWLYQYRTIVQRTTASGVPVVIRKVERTEADHILNQAMEVLGVGRVTRWMIYAGVRLGGRHIWNTYRQEEMKVCPTPLHPE